MSTWQLLSDSENNFHWEISDQELLNEPQCDMAAQRLPSMADLLLLGCSRIVDNGREGNSDNSPMFRTGLGKSVALKQSSIEKARSVLRDIDNAVFNDTGYSRLVENGKGNIESSPMFRTGLGKSVSLKQSSIVKARSVLGDINDAVFNDAGQFNGKGGRYSTDAISLGLANTMESRLPHTSDSVVNISTSMFQTGSGKTVNISSAGLLRAKTLLGLEETYEEDSLNCSRKTPLQSSATKHPAQKNPQLEPEELQNFNSSTKGYEPFEPCIGVKSDLFGSDSAEFSAFTIGAAKPPPVKFQTAGGRSISVSSEALRRARSLLGNPELDSFLDEAGTADLVLPTTDDGNTCFPSDPIINFRTPLSSMDTGKGDGSYRNFTSPLKSSAYQKRSLAGFEKLQPGSNLITQFDAAVVGNTDTRVYTSSSCSKNPLNSTLYPETANCLSNGVQMKTDPLKSSSKQALVDISNCVNIERAQNRQPLGEKRRLGRNSSVSAFKKPRSSFVTPVSRNNSVVISAFSRLAPKEPCCKERVSTRYPPPTRRAYLKDFMLQPPYIQRQLKDLPNHVRSMNPDAAESYIFQNEPDLATGPDNFYLMLSESGASSQHMTKEWVSNHYKWIVWKLACYERFYPDKFLGKLLTVSNVLEELKYRYELEVNHGYRSAIRKILDGDAPPSSMMILCISSVVQSHDSTNATQLSSKADGIGGAAKIELTDGWYSVKALLDEHLSRKLASGRLFLGQKIRIWGAKLFGWVGPISPSEASQSAGLILHINGTYRCHWAERLGFCKNSGFPLAFRCIKASGGPVPCTLIGITRIYPILYKERSISGSVIVRSERAETQVLQSYNQRRSAVAEGIMSTSEKEMGVHLNEPYDCDGAKIMKLLETAAEPEVLMAGMSSKQLASFSTYKAKLEASRQLNMEKSIEKALEAAGLTEREVTPFFRVRVVGLHKKCCSPVSAGRNGLITIWNPTEKQKMELCEGKAYNVGGLQPSGCDSGIIYLIAKGSTANWIPLPPSTMENFETFFTPRSSVAISNLGEIPLCSEFDTAALVIHVGEVSSHGSVRKQWVFVADGSTLSSKEASDELLAISFCVPYTRCDSFPPVNSNIAGSVVGFCNLIKKSRDPVNNMWVADAAENSDYFLSYDHASRKHLKDAAASVLKLTNTSSLMIDKLRKRVLSIIS